MSCSVKSVLTQGLRKIVSINGMVIRHHDISREVQNHPSSTPMAAWTAAARALVVRELLLQEARRLELEPTVIADAEGRRETSDEALVRSLIDQEVAVPAADEASCRRYFDNNRRRFHAADIYEASHILIAARRDDCETFAAARERAAELIGLIQADPSRFADIAKASSQCASAASGGNLGQLTRGATTPEFERALFALKPGQMTAAPVETRYGWHIIRLDRHIPGCELPFGVVQLRIAEYLSDAAHRVAAAQYIARLAARADVRGVELPSASDLRVH